MEKKKFSLSKWQAERQTIMLSPLTNCHLLPLFHCARFGARSRIHSHIGCGKLSAGGLREGHIAFEQRTAGDHLSDGFSCEYDEVPERRTGRVRVDTNAVGVNDQRLGGAGQIALPVVSITSAFHHDRAEKLQRVVCWRKPNTRLY